MMTNNIARFARVFAALGFGVFALAACAVDPQDGEEGTAQSQEALINNGGGPRGNGFSCDVDSDVCTCDKNIAGDCDGMRDLCQGSDLPGFDTCVGGWLTTNCSCRAALVKKRPPVVIGPIFGSSGGVVKTW